MLLYQESFDSPNDQTDYGYTLRHFLLNVNTSWTADLTGGRFGGGAYKVTAATNDAVRVFMGKVATNTTIRMAWSMRLNSSIGGSLTGTRKIMGLQDRALTRFFNMFLLGGKLTVTKFDDINVTTAVGTSTTTINDDAWHHYEVELLAHTSSGILKVWIDGVLEINVSGDTSDAVSGDVTVFDCVNFGGSSNTGGTFTGYWDDIIVWDDDSSDGFTGHLTRPHRITCMLPDAAGDSTQFTPSAGSNYACVNAVKTNDDTDYVESGTVGHIDLYNVGAMTPNPVNIFCVAAEHWARKEDIGPLTHRPIVKSNGTVGNGTTVTPSNGYYKRYQTFLNPDGNIAWTKTTLEASQIGVEIVS